MHRMSLCGGEQDAGCQRKGCFENPGKKGRRGSEMGKEGGREIVTPRRWVQRQGNERLPALHHAQGLPQSAGGRGKMPHVSALLAPLLLCVHLGLRVSQDGEEAENQEFSRQNFTPARCKCTPPSTKRRILACCFFYLIFWFRRVMVA